MANNSDKDRFSVFSPCAEPACNWCYASKQGCDRRTPTCGNCFRRGLKCTYTPVPCGRPPKLGDNEDENIEKLARQRSKLLSRIQKQATFPRRPKKTVAKQIKRRFKARDTRSEDRLTYDVYNVARDRRKQINTRQGCGDRAKYRMKRVPIAGTISRPSLRPTSKRPIAVRQATSEVEVSTDDYIPQSDGGLQRALQGIPVVQNPLGVMVVTYDPTGFLNEAKFQNVSSIPGSRERVIPLFDLVYVAGMGWVDRGDVERFAYATQRGWVAAGWGFLGTTGNDLITEGQAREQELIPVYDTNGLRFGFLPPGESTVLRRVYPDRVTFFDIPLHLVERNPSLFVYSRFDEALYLKSDLPSRLLSQRRSVTMVGRARVDEINQGIFV
jgi:hypothetical protein